MPGPTNALQENISDEQKLKICNSDMPRKKC